MGKLLQVKEWVDFEDAAKYLSEAWDENIYLHDIIALVNQKKLDISLFLPDGISIIDGLQTSRIIGHVSGLVDVCSPCIETWGIDCDLYYRAGENIALTYEGKALSFTLIDDQFYLTEILFACDGPPPEAKLVIRTKTLNDLIYKVSDTKKNRPKVDNPKAMNSLLKMFIAMAVDCYCYDPKASRNEATSDIVEAVEKIGQKIDADTVRSWLKKGNEYLDETED